MTAGIVFMVLYFLFGVIFGVWIYRDAVLRGENGGQWLFLLIIGNVMTVCVWLIVRPPFEEDEGVFDIVEYRKREINDRKDSFFDDWFTDD